MKHPVLRSLSFLLAVASVVLCFACYPITVSAASYVKGTNPASDSYKSGKYYQHHQNVTITGDNVTDVLAMAISQLGYQEGASDGSFAGTTGGSNNFTEYNYNMGKISGSYGGSSYAWCASFISWCLLQGGATAHNSQSHWCRSHTSDKNYIWREVSCAQWFNQLERFGYGKKRGTYTPESGDLIFFWNGSRISHIGIVLYCEGGTVYTIEGNTSSGSGLDSNGGGVYFKNYSLTSTYIHGYGDMPYKTNASVNKIDYSGKKPTTGLYMSTTAKYLYPSENASSHSVTMPKYTMFNVTRVCSNGRLEISYNGGTYYVLNNTDRVIQLSDSRNVAGTPSASLIKSTMDAHTIDGRDVSGTISVNAGQLVGLRGWAGYTVAISKYGYYFDNKTSDQVWSNSPNAETEPPVITIGGANAKRFHIQADTSSLSAGSHTITFVLKLSDNSVQTLDTLSFTVKASSSGGSGGTTTPHTCSFGDWYTTKSASCSAEGERTRRCSCGKSESEPIPTTEHTESDWIVDVAAQPGVSGSQHTECTVCHAPINTATIPALPALPSDPVTTQPDGEIVTDPVVEDDEAATQPDAEPSVETEAELSTEDVASTVSSEETQAADADTAEEATEGATEETTVEDDSGSLQFQSSCASSIGAGSVMLMVVAAGVLLKKKKED